MLVIVNTSIVIIVCKSIYISPLLVRLNGCGIYTVQQAILIQCDSNSQLKGVEIITGFLNYEEPSYMYCIMVGNYCYMIT